MTNADPLPGEWRAPSAGGPALLGPFATVKTIFELGLLLFAAAYSRWNPFQDPRTSDQELCSCFGVAMTAFDKSLCTHQR